MAHPPCLHQQGYQGEQHAGEGSVLQEHLLEAARFHVRHSNGGNGDEGNSCRPSQLTIQKMDNPLLQCLLMHLFFALIVVLHVVPLPVSRPVILRKELPVLTWQDNLLHETGG